MLSGFYSIVLSLVMPVHNVALFELSWFDYLLPFSLCSSLDWCPAILAIIIRFCCSMRFPLSFYIYQQLPLCTWSCDNSYGHYDSGVWSTSVAVGGNRSASCLISYAHRALYVSASLLQRSGDILLHLGLSAENEITHTLSFLAGMMIWSQVWIWLFPFSLKSKLIMLQSDLWQKIAVAFPD